MNNKFLPIILPSLFIVALILVWQVLSTSGLVPETVLAPPAVVVAALQSMYDTGELQGHIIASVSRVLIGFALGGSIGFVLGVLVGLSKFFERLLNPSIELIQLVPVFAWAPLMILLLGVEEKSKIAFIAIACFYPILIMTREGIQTIKGRYLEVANVFEIRGIRLLKAIALPALTPSLLTGIRQSLALAWMAVVGAEIMGAESGIGFLMTMSRQLFQLDGVLAGVFLVGIIGIGMNFLIELFEKIFVPWKKEV